MPNSNFNTDVRIGGSWALYVNEVKVVDESWNIDAPVTTTNLTTSGNTTIGDSSGDTLTINATASLVSNMTIAATKKITTAQSNTVVPVMLTTVQQALSWPWAVALTAYYTAVTTTGADALTLADATTPWLMKKVQMIVDWGTWTLTFNTNATIEFADVGDTAELIWNGADRIPVALYNCADWVTAPAYTPAA